MCEPLVRFPSRVRAELLPAMGGGRSADRSLVLGLTQSLSTALTFTTVTNRALNLFSLLSLRLRMASPPSARVSRSTFSRRVTLYTPARPEEEEPKPITSAHFVRRSTRSIKPDPSPAQPSAPSPARSRRVKPEPASPSSLKPDPDQDTKPAKAKSPAKPKPFKRYLDTPHPEPKRWRQAFEIIREQRKRSVLPSPAPDSEIVWGRR